MRLSDDWRLRLRLESTRCGVGARCSCWGGVWYGTTDDCWMCVVPSPPAVAPGRGDAGEDDDDEEEEEEEEEEDARFSIAFMSSFTAQTGLSHSPSFVALEPLAPMEVN